jgi:toxin-antitoxin system PIN domain toxin
LSKAAYLPDVNVLIALSDPDHSGHHASLQWHQSIQSQTFLLCPITEAGFVRLKATQSVGGQSIDDAIALIEEISSLPNVAHLPVAPTWLELIRPLLPRLHGHRQITDALLLGLSIRHNAILVTLDRKIQALAGPQFKANLLTLV